MMLEAFDADTRRKWVRAMRVKLAHGSINATELILNRLLGKPVQGIHLQGDAKLQAFMVAWAELRGEMVGEVPEEIPDGDDST